MAVRDGVPASTDYDKPITVVKYIYDVTTFILSPTGVAYVEGGKCAVAGIKREG